MRPHPHSVLYPRGVVARGYTEIYFGENQIFAGLISLLLLSTAHPPGLQPRWVRASTDCYVRFTLAMDSSPAFGSAPCYRDALLTLAFASAPPLRGLTWQHRATRRLIIQKARRHTLPLPPEGGRHAPHRPEDGAVCGGQRQMVLRQLVGVRFQVLFHLRLTGLLFIFRSRYFCAIGRPGVLSLGRWSSRIQAGFHVSDPTRGRVRRGPSPFAYGTITLCGAAFQNASARRSLCNSAAGPCRPAKNAPHDPGNATRQGLARSRFRLVPFRSPLLGESLLLSFPAGTEMCQFPAFAPTPYVFRRRYPGITPGGLPHSEISGSQQVAAPRSLSQLTTSFIASGRLDIHRTPLVS